MKPKNLTTLPLAAAVVPVSSGSYGWVMSANLVIWGGIALYFLLLGRRARRLERR